MNLRRWAQNFIAEAFSTIEGATVEHRPLGVPWSDATGRLTLPLQVHVQFTFYPSWHRMFALLLLRLLGAPLTLTAEGEVHPAVRLQGMGVAQSAEAKPNGMVH